MYPSSTEAHGFNHQSSYRQPVSNLRRVDEIVWSENNVVQQISDARRPSVSSTSDQQSISEHVNLERQIYPSLEDNIVPPIDLQNESNEIEQRSRKATVNKKNAGLAKDISRVAKSEKSSKQHREPATSHENQHRLLTRQASLGAMPNIDATRSNDVAPLTSSRSFGAIEDYVKKERRSHTMPPVARISGPNSNLKATMFARIAAPSEPQAMASSELTQSVPDTADASYSSIYGESNDAVDGVNEEIDDYDNAAPIIVKVRYDPETGGPPPQDFIRELVNNKLRGRSNQELASDPIVFDFRNNALQPKIPQIPIRPQQPYFNRPALPAPQPMSYLPPRNSAPLQQQNLQLLQQQQLQLQKNQHQQQQIQQELLLKQQTQKQQMQLDQQIREQLQLEQQKRQQLQLEQQKRQQLQLEQQRRQQLQLEQQRRQQLQLEQERRQQLQLEQERRQQLQLEQQKRQQLQLEQQKRQQLQLEQQKRQQLQLEQQRRQQLQLEQQRRQRLQLEQRRRQQLQLEQQKVQQQKNEKLQLEVNQILQQQQNYRQLMQKNEQQQQLQKRQQQIYQQRRQNLSLPPTGLRPSRSVPSMQPISVNPTPPMLLQNRNTRPIQHFPIAPIPIRSGQPISTISIQKIPTRYIRPPVPRSPSLPGHNRSINYPPQPAPSLFIPIGYDKPVEQQSISSNNINTYNLPQNLSQRPLTAPPSIEFFRPSSALDIPELSRENLRNMLNEIPALHGRRFSIEYIEPSEPKGYPIPSAIDYVNKGYPEPVIVHQLPNAIIQHVRNSNDRKLQAALSLPMPQDHNVQPVNRTRPLTPTLNRRPSLALHHNRI